MELNKLKIAGLTIVGCVFVVVMLLIFTVDDPDDAIQFLWGLLATSMTAVLILAYFDIRKHLN